MIIEWLKVSVPRSLRERYIELDAEIWTSVLAQQSGFVSKQVWTSPEDPSEIVMVIQWATRQQWKAISQDLLESTDRRFTAALGHVIPFTATGEYHLHRADL